MWHSQRVAVNKMGCLLRERKEISQGLITPILDVLSFERHYSIMARSLGLTGYKALLAFALIGGIPLTNGDYYEF